MIDKLKISKNLLRQLDFGILILAVCIAIFGTLNIYSATFHSVGITYSKLQITWIVLGLIATYVILLFDYMLIMNYASLIYWAGVILLAINDFLLGDTVNGATGWIKIGSRAIQPSEFAKLGMIIMLAKLIEEMEGNINNPKNLIKLILYAALPMALIVIQPDMGLTMICFFIVLGMFYIAGLDWRVMTGGISAVLLAVIVIWNSSLMQIHWKARLVSFLNPQKYSQSYGLQLIESRKAIGSGGIFGVGFLKGKQFKFVPEYHTDCIFSVVGEEWGLLGAIFLICLYMLLIYRLIKIAKSSKDIFGTILSVGVISSLLFSVLQNIGMNIGIMPITGITLPFMSYGGSSMLTTFMALGLVLNVGMRRKKINF